VTQQDVREDAKGGALFLIACVPAEPGDYAGGLLPIGAPPGAGHPEGAGLVPALRLCQGRDGPPGPGPSPRRGSEEALLKEGELPLRGDVPRQEDAAVCRGVALPVEGLESVPGEAGDVFRVAAGIEGVGGIGHHRPD